MSSIAKALSEQKAAFTSDDRQPIICAHRSTREFMPLANPDAAL
ncbi:nitroreductase [Aspergillus luchuensis]|uniref:Nitroreductase n=1 Tax=Aspergillus kawachii TaxID=1069201 RepID=A0A146FB94_ASPKA|nr:nitroreductase [Aspergillus luchuensis]